MKSFLSLHAQQRLLRLRHLIETFANNARTLDAPFSVLSYGSANYGLNESNQGKLDDLDFFLIIDRNVDPEEFLFVVEMVFLTRLQIQTPHLHTLLQGGCDICRMYGLVDDIKVGFRIMCLDAFEDVCGKGFGRMVRNVASIGQSRILDDEEWHFRLRHYVPILYPHRYTRIGEEDVLEVLHYCFSKKSTRLGPLGRKLLSASVTFEASGHKVSASLHSLWNTFVKISKQSKRHITPNQIVDSIMRSERFSPEFRAKLCKLAK